LDLRKIHLLILKPIFQKETEMAGRKPRTPKTGGRECKKAILKNNQVMNPHFTWWPRAEATGILPAEYLLSVMRDENNPIDVRMEAAAKTAPYYHARLAAIEHSGDGNGPIQHKVIIEYVKPEPEDP
jgi:hypothetical protein